MKESTYDENSIKRVFRNYRKMDSKTIKILEANGFSLTKRKRKHWLLLYRGLSFTLPATSSDRRAGMNFYSTLRRSIQDTNFQED